MTDVIEKMKEHLGDMMDARFEERRLYCVECHDLVSQHNPQKAYRCLRSLALKEQIKFQQSLTKQ